MGGEERGGGEEGGGGWGGGARGGGCEGGGGGWGGREGKGGRELRGGGGEEGVKVGGKRIMQIMNDCEEDHTVYTERAVLSCACAKKREDGRLG